MRYKLSQIQHLLLILTLFTTSQANAYRKNPPADYIISDYIFELIEDCLGKEKFSEILNEEKGRWLYFSYSLNGSLENIGTGYIFNNYQKAYFLEEEWERIFDYFHDLPPFPIANPVSYTHKEKKYHNLDIEQTINRLGNNNKIGFRCSWQFRGNYNNHSCPKNKLFYDWFEKNLYNYDFSIRGENPDSLFGKMHWSELGAQYYDKYNSGKLKPDTVEHLWSKGNHFKQTGYYWEKIPIKNYTVNLQIPLDSKITIAPDTLSATVNFPDSTYVLIQYTKGLPYTKLWNNEGSPRKRLIDSLDVNSIYILSRGYFVLNGNYIYWIRIRYRYGITITIYSKHINWIDNYYKTVIIPATIVLRPKFKNIYLND